MWTRKDPKGIVKVGYILDAIIALWEEIEFVEEMQHDQLFFKIDFEKSYYGLVWDFILKLLEDMSPHIKCIRMISMLLGIA